MVSLLLRRSLRRNISRVGVAATCTNQAARELPLVAIGGQLSSRSTTLGVAGIRRAICSSTSRRDGDDSWKGAKHDKLDDEIFNTSKEDVFRGFERLKQEFAAEAAAEAQAKAEASGQPKAAGGRSRAEATSQADPESSAEADGESKPGGDHTATRFRNLIQKFAPPPKKKGGRHWVPKKPPAVDNLGRSFGLGRRKRSVARVWVTLSDGEGGVFMINKRPMSDYFTRDVHQNEIIKPLLTLHKLGHFNVRCTAFGGGHTGQAGAIRLGLARALENHEPWWRRQLKKAGLLTRDARKVERKKPGLVKARKAPQWVKR